MAGPENGARVAMSLEEGLAEARRKYRNWGRWGPDDVLGTLNFTDDANRARAAALIRRGRIFPLAIEFSKDGPRTGERGRSNPIHTMLDLGEERPGDTQGYGDAESLVFMPLRAGTHWDGLGHIFDHGTGWNGRPRESVITGAGDLVTGIEHQAGRFVSRGVLLDVGLVIGGGELDDGFAIGEEHLHAVCRAHGVTPGRGDIVLVRTGQLARCRRVFAAQGSWEGYARGPSPAPGLSFGTLGWLHGSEIAAIASDTCSLEVRPPEFSEPCIAPLHQIAIPNIGLFIGEMFDLDELAADCAADGVYEFLLVAPGLPVTGGVGSPVNPIAIK
jgi:kynurenine formamidase